MECGSVTCDAREPLPDPQFQIQVSVSVSDSDNQLRGRFRQGNKRRKESQCDRRILTTSDPFGDSIRNLKLSLRSRPHVEQMSLIRTFCARVMSVTSFESIIGITDVYSRALISYQLTLLPEFK